MVSKIIRADGVTELASIKTVTYHESVNADTDLRPGCVASSYIEVTCFGSQSDAPAVGEALTYYQVVGETETLIGIFYAEPSIPTKNSYSFIAYDAVHKLDADFSAWLSANQDNFPYTVYQLVSQACTISGVTLGTSSWDHSTMQVNAWYADSITCRNIIQYAAEIGCKFVRCHTNGQIYFDWYSTASNQRIYPSSGTSGSETRYAYKQDGLNYDNYSTSALARVAVHPVGEDDVAYYYPTGVTSGNTLDITNNALLYGASAADMSGIAQTVYNGITAVGQYRPMDVSMFPNECPFSSGQIVPVTDAQGVSFTTAIMQKTVTESAVTLTSTGREVYGDYALDTAKKLIQLAADIVQINKLKVDWAEIDQIFARDITVTGRLHSDDYSYSTGEIYANQGMGMDFGAKRYNTPNFGITPDGKVYAQGGKIAGFNLKKGISLPDGTGGYPRIVPSVYKTDGTASTSYTFMDGVLQATDAGYAVYNVTKTKTISGIAYRFLQVSVKYTSSTPVAYTALLQYYDANDNLIDYDRVSIMPTGNLVKILPRETPYTQCDHMTLRVNYSANATVQTVFAYGNYYSLYTENPHLGQGSNNVYVGDEGISLGQDIILTPDGVGKFKSLDVEEDTKVSKTGDTMIGTISLKGENFPDTDANTPYIRFIDSTDRSWGYLEGFRNSGNTRGGLLLSGGYRGYQSSNQLALLTETDGTPYVYIPSSAVQPWRYALGLGTSGALPITIGQGGSGQTDAISTYTVSDIATPGASNTTITSASYAQWGKVAMVHLVFTRTVNTGTNTDVLLATIISGKRPKTMSMAVVRYTGANAVGYIESTGSVRLNTPTSIPSGTQIVIDATYILE